jgi:hypothetical protein
VHELPRFQVLFAPIQIQFPTLSSGLAIGVARRPAGTPGSSLPNGYVSGILPDSQRVLRVRTNFGLGGVERSKESRLDADFIPKLIPESQFERHRHALNVFLRNWLKTSRQDHTLNQVPTPMESKWEAVIQYF